MAAITGLDAVTECIEQRISSRTAELADIGAAHEDRARAAQHHRPGCIIGIEPLSGIEKPSAYCVAQCVHRRVVDRHDQ
jgi:hypothetical protein